MRGRYYISPKLLVFYVSRAYENKKKIIKMLTIGHKKNCPSNNGHKLHWNWIHDVSNRENN